MEDYDSMSIYIQNIPPDITHECLNKIFSRCGKVIHISIPKYSETKHAKGFAFIIYKTKEEAEKAVNELNNVIPKELFTSHNKQIEPLEIIPKKEWLLKKEEFRKLKQELQKEDVDLFAECLGMNSKSITTPMKGTIVKLTNLPNDKIDKFDIKIWVSHFVEPAYVDYNKNTNQCIIRFTLPILADSFIKRISNDEEFKFNGMKVIASKIDGEEEDEYLKKIENLKNEFKNKVMAKKRKRKYKN
jgi:RNA recognition motif-containing protein